MMPRNWMRCLAALLALMPFACAPTPSGPPVDLVVSIEPVAMIVRPLLAEGARVHVLAPGGASPHTYAPKPADARAASEAKLLLHIAEDLDGWATELGAAQALPLLSLVPPGQRLPYTEIHEHDGHTHHHQSIDPHFWLDPTLVAEIIPALVERLADAGIAADPQRAAAFGAELASLDAKLHADLAPLQGQAVAQFHPSMNYFFHQYAIRNGGYIESSPGKEASAKYLHEMSERLQTENVLAVATEPQLPEAPARAVAEAASIPLITLDPLGGTQGRATYPELITFNLESLQAVAP